jgi:hypothetical protein
MGCLYVLPECLLLRVRQLCFRESPCNEIELLGLGVVIVASPSFGKTNNEAWRSQLCIGAMVCPVYFLHFNWNLQCTWNG